MSRCHRTSILAAGLVVITLANNARAQWQPATGPRSPNVVSVSQGGGTTFLGATQHDTGGPVYRSVDAGHSWILTEGGTPLELFPHHDGIVYGGGVYVGLWRSEDDGINWSRVTGVPTNGSGVVLAACAETLFARVSGITEPSRLYRSTDDGETWTMAAGGLPTLTHYSDVRCQGTTVLAAVGSEIYRSSNAGETWALVGAGLPPGAWVDVLAVGDGAFWAGVSGDAQAFGVYRSPDGEAWSRVGLALAPATAVRFQDLLAEPGRLLAAVAGSEPFDTGDIGLHLSTDGGVEWSRIWNGFPNPAQAVATVGGDMLLGTSSGAYRSSDDGATWTFSGAGTARLASAPAVVAHDEIFLAGTSDQDVIHDVWRSTDAGVSWSSAEAGLNPNAHATALLAFGGAVLAGVYGAGRGIFRSVDAGGSWLPTTGIASGSIIRALHAHGDVVLAGAFEGMYRSTDGGQTWEPITGAPPQARAFTSEGSTLYAGTPAGVFRSTDDGLSWVAQDAGLPDVDVHALTTTTAGVLAGLEGHGIHRLVDDAWVPSGLPGATINAFLAIDGAFVAGGTAVAYSMDQGLTWTALDDGLTGLAVVLSLAATDETLLAGTGQGLWTRPVADIQVPTGAPAAGGGAPEAYVVGDLRPNPFGASATLTLEVGATQRVTIRAFDALGRRVASLFDGMVAAGAPRVVELEMPGLPAGMYAIHVAGDAFSSTRLGVHRP